MAERDEAYQAMVGAVQGVTQQCGTSFYSGYTDRKEEGVWLGAGGQQHWGVWGEGQPNRDSTHIVILHDSLLFYKYEGAPVCRYLLLLMC